MIGWIIAGAILLLFIIILFVHVNVVLEMKDEFSLSVKVLGLTLFEHPKEAKIKPRMYTLKKIRKRDERAAKDAESKRLAKEKKKLTPEEEARKKKEKAEKKARRKETTPALSDMISLICEVLKLFCSRFFGKLHIKFAKLHVRVGGADAMQAAVLYGVANQAVQYLVAFLQKICHVDGLKKADFRVEPDFLSESIEFEFKMTLRLTVGHVLGAVLRSGVKFLGGFLKIRPTPKHPRYTIKPDKPDRPDKPPVPDKHI